MPTRRDRARQALARDLRIVRGVVPVVRRAMRIEAAAVVAAIEDGEPDGTSGVRLEAWEETIGRVWLAAGEGTYRQHLAELVGAKAADGARYSARETKQTGEIVALIERLIGSPTRGREVARFIAERADGVVATTRRRITTVLRGVGPPAQVRDLVRQVRKLYATEFVTTKANRIALDNVLAATTTFEAEAVVEAAARTGREYVKAWATQGDSVVRESHVAADGQTQPIGVPFTVGGALLDRPRDPNGPASETANCRCWAEHRRV